MLIHKAAFIMEKKKEQNCFSTLTESKNGAVPIPTVSYYLMFLNPIGAVMIGNVITTNIELFVYNMRKNTPPLVSVELFSADVFLRDFNISFFLTGVDHYSLETSINI